MLQASKKIVLRKNMKLIAGLWIDHREAIIVTLTGSGEEIKHLHSAVEKQLRREGEPANGAFEAQQAPADDSRQREYTGHLAHYYDAIIKHLHDAGSILIFGPGEAKGELKKQFEKHDNPTAPRVITLETTDKLTEPQILAKVRHHFHRDPPRI